MQSIYTSRIAVAEDGAEEASASSSASSSSSSSPLRLTEYAISVTHQALYHAPALYAKLARFLSSRGLLVYPSPDGQSQLLVSVVPFLPSQPSSVRRLSSLSAATGWTLLLKAIDHQQYDSASMNGTDDRDTEMSASMQIEKHQLEVGQPKEWTIEAEIGVNSDRGVADSIIQACISYTVSLELNRQGWYLAGDRYIRMPNDFATSSCVAAIQLNLTLSQGIDLTVYMNVQQIRFNSIDTKGTKSVDTESLNVKEQPVYVLPDLKEGLILRVVGMATQANSKALGVDRESWFERHGYTLPVSYPVVEVQLGLDDWSTSKVTVPLCCCLTSNLTFVNVRPTDEAAKAKQQKEATETVKEMLVILKNIRVIAPSSGSMKSLLSPFTEQSIDPLLAAMNPFVRTTHVNTMISVNMGFKSAKSIASSQDGDMNTVRSHKKPKLKLTLGSSGRTSSTLISLASVKASTQLPASTPLVASFSSGGFGFSSFCSSRPSSTASISTGDKTTEKNDAALKSIESKSSRMSLSSSRTPSKRKDPPSSKPISTACTNKMTAAASSDPKKSKPSLSTSKEKPTKSRSSVGIVKTSSSVKKTSKGASEKAKKVTAPWSADFEAAFQQQLTSADRSSQVAAFQKVAGETTDVIAPITAISSRTAATPMNSSSSKKSIATQEGSKKVKSKSSSKAKQTKLNFTPA